MVVGKKIKKIDAKGQELHSFAMLLTLYKNISSESEQIFSAIKCQSYKETKIQSYLLQFHPYNWPHLQTSQELRHSLFKGHKVIVDIVRNVISVSSVECQVTLFSKNLKIFRTSENFQKI